MEFLNFDPATKNLSVVEGSTQDWSEQDQTDYAYEVENLNTLSKQLVGFNGDIPPPGNQINGNLSKQIDKLRETAIRDAKLGKHTEALKLLSMALEMALRRPLWESVQFQMGQIVGILNDRCDLYIKTNQWANAYADTHILTTLQPGEWSNFYRKALCLRKIENYHEAKALLATALELGKNNTSAVVKVNQEISSIDALLA